VSMTLLTTKSAVSKSNLSANSILHAKPIYQGPIWSCLMTKTRGRKSSYVYCTLYSIEDFQRYNQSITILK
jgi:hypothetical protein